jgi:hypothetical protein
MRPTAIRFIVGGALGIAFSVSLMLPGAVVFPAEAPIRHLAAPDLPSRIIVRAAPVAAPKKAPARRRVVVRPVYVPTIRRAPAASVVRPPSSAKPSPRPIPHTSPPARQRLTPLSAQPAEHAKAKKPKKAKKEMGDEDGRLERDRGDEGKDEGKDKVKDKDDDQGKDKGKGKGKDDEGDGDEGGGERGDDSVGG